MIPKVRLLFSKDLYAQGRSNAGVLFASIPNFADFYSEDVNEGMECIRLLNEIIGEWTCYFLKFNHEKKYLAITSEFYKATFHHLKIADF